MAHYEGKARIQNQKGLHARAAAKFVKVCTKYRADVTVVKKNMKVNGASILELMLLAAGIGEILTISVKGRDAKKALKDLMHLVENRFEEEE